MSNLPMLYTDRDPGRLLPQLSFGGGRIGNPVFLNSGQAPFTNFNTTYDIVANLTKVMGTHAAKAGFYFQRSQKPQSAFTNFNGQYNFDNSANNPYDSQNGFANAALGHLQQFNQASSYLKPNWRYTNFEWYLQDNWRVTDRLTLDYGVRFYYLTPQWDTSLQASNFLPDEFDKSRGGPAVQAGRGGRRARGLRRERPARSVNSAYIGRVVPDIGRPVPGDVPGRPGHRRDAHRRQQVQGVAARRRSPTTSPGAQTLVARGGFGDLLRPAAGQPGVRPDHQPARPAGPRRCMGAGEGCRAAATRLQPPVGLNPNVYELEDADGLPVEHRRAVEDACGVRPRRRRTSGRSRGICSSSGRSTRCRTARPTCRRARTRPAARRARVAPRSARRPAPTPCRPTSCVPYPGYGGIRMWEFSAYSNYKALQTTISRRF